MLPEISGMPILQAEDDGFLRQLKMEILDRHLKTLELDDCSSIDRCVSKLLDASAGSKNKGAMLPLYVPAYSDDGYMYGYQAVPVWSGADVDVLLYGALETEKVEALITGNRFGASELYEGFLQYSPAFRVALLVHHMCQVVLIEPMAAEAFILGRYAELPLNDRHFEETGIPTTNLIYVESKAGLRTEWTMQGKNALSGSRRSTPRIKGWSIRIRGAVPKEELFLDAWKEVRRRLDDPIETGRTTNGIALVRREAMPSGRSRKRAGNPYVSKLIEWINEAMETSRFPMRGSMKDWQKAIALLELENPSLVGRWSADSMRKAYERWQRENR